MTSAPWFLLNEFPPRRWIELFIGLIQFRHPESFPQTNGVRTCYAGAAFPLPCVRCDATIAPAGNHYPTGAKHLEKQTKTSSTIHFWLSTTIKGIGTFSDYFPHTEKAMEALLHENTRCFYIKRSPPSRSYLLLSGWCWGVWRWEGRSE